MARSVEEVRSIGNLAKSRGLRAMVGHTYLFSPAVRFIKQYLDSGQLGDILSIYSQRLNLGKVRSDVDALWNLAPHDIAMIQYWLDNKKPTEINRVGQSFLQADIDDVVYLTMKYSSGTIASIQVSWMDPTKTRKTVLVGSKGMIVFDDTAEDKIQVLNKSISINSGHTVAGQAESGHFSNPEFTYSDDGVQIPKLVDTEPLAAELGHFFDCIEDNSLECLCDYRHAESVVRILSGNLDD